MTHTPPQQPVTQHEAELALRLARVEETLKGLCRKIDRLAPPEQDAFTPAEFGEIVGLSAYTVRDHIKSGRLRATRALSGRGAAPGWRLSRDELRRYRAEGLLPGKVPVAARGEGH